jgi:hypothetical protein
MGGGLLNLAAKGNINIILNGNPQKTFFKKTYAKYKNFGLQRFEIQCKNNNNDKNILTDSFFNFVIPFNGDMLLDTCFSFDIPDIYSPIYTSPHKVDKNGHPIPSYTSKNYYCQPYEFKWIENLGSQFIKKVTYLIDGRVIQEYSGHYLYCKSQRDLNIGRREKFNTMTGNIVELYDPANFSNNNGNYPNVSWGNLNRTDWPNGVQPSILGKKLYIPLYLWETFSSYRAIPLISLYYSRLEINIECRPLNELFVIRDLNYYDNFIKDISLNTGIPCDPKNIFKYYNPPFISPIFNDLRYSYNFFTQPPPENTVCLGEVTYNPYVKTEQDAFKDILQTYYTDKTNPINCSLYSTYVFLSEEERSFIAGMPQRYLIKQIFEKTIHFTQGFHRENVDANGSTVSWMWFFQRSDVVLRNEWSNYSNWPYKDIMPYPGILTLDLSYTLIDLETVNTPYITPPKAFCTSNIDQNYNPCLQYISGPVHPGNTKEIMTEWGLYCNELERETLFPEGINNYIEKYLVLDGDLADGIYSYNFNIEKITNFHPSGSMNMVKFSKVSFEFETINPFREMIPNATGIGELKINLSCDNSDDRNYIDSAWGANIDEYFNETNPAGDIVTVQDQNYTNFDYNYNLHIMEERYNILEFSGGIAKLLF